MRIGILLHKALRRVLEFLDGLIGKLRQLLLQRIALVRGRLLQIGLYLFLLIDEGVARVEVRFESFELSLGLLSFFYLFLGSAPLFGDDVLEVEIDLGFLTALHSALDLVGRLFVIRRRKYNKDGVNARAQVRQIIFACAIRLGFLFSALVAYAANDNLRPGIPIHVQDRAGNRPSLGRSARCQHACQRDHQDGGKRPRLKNTLHAAFSFFTGGALPGVSGPGAPHYLSQAGRFQAQRPAVTVLR